LEENLKKMSTYPNFLINAIGHTVRQAISCGMSATHFIEEVREAWSEELREKQRDDDVVFAEILKDK
jgi:hypothetical protein